MFNMNDSNMVIYFDMTLIKHKNRIIVQIQKSNLFEKGPTLNLKIGKLIIDVHQQQSVEFVNKALCVIIYVLLYLSLRA